ncbi:MAG: hypothetical protein Q8K04_12125 [Lutibacter sp.]|jgi:hypothetical protein|nr:hypothetical protein [Lutibacter sp.]MDP3946155.1 hypothetical protein [Lutibacter sp.]
MKKFKFLAVMALFMVFGCAKDEVITDEHKLFSEENNQSVNWKSGVGPRINFYGTSNESGGYYDLLKNPTTDADRKLLKKGTFSGKLPGFGHIKFKVSTYEFSTPEETVSQKNDSIYCDESGYLLTAEGKIILESRDSCSISITGYLCTTADNFAGFSGVAKTHSGVGKLKNFNKWFKVYQNGISSPGINLTTGEIRLYLSESNF